MTKFNNNNNKINIKLILVTDEDKFNKFWYKPYMIDWRPITKLDYLSFPKNNNIPHERHFWSLYAIGIGPYEVQTLRDKVRLKCNTWHQLLYKNIKLLHFYKLNDIIQIYSRQV